MSSNHNNSHKPLPLSEDQLCDWIDGNLSDEQVSRMLAASGRSDLNDRVAQMQLQKAALASVPVERAPRDLHDRTMAALEREMLLGAVEEERSSNGTTPSLRLVSDPDAALLSKARAERTRKALPGLAMAAGLLLVVGGTAYFVAQTISLSRKPLAQPSIAQNRTQPSLVDPVGATEIAMGDAKNEAAAMKMSADAPGAAASRATDMSLAGATREAVTEPVTVALDRAAELASEGRLAIRVLSDDLSGLKTFEQVGSNGVQKNWRVQKDVPAQVVASVLPAAFPAGSTSVMNDPRMLASEIVTPLAGFGAAFGSNIFASNAGPNAHDTSPISKVRASYLVTVPATETGLDVLRTTLRNRLRGAVEFIELPAAVTTQAADNARDALWWTQATSQWTPKATIPLLVAKP